MTSFWGARRREPIPAEWMPLRLMNRRQARWQAGRCRGWNNAGVRTFFPARGGSCPLFEWCGWPAPLTRPPARPIAPSLDVARRLEISTSRDLPGEPEGILGTAIRVLNVALSRVAGPRTVTCAGFKSRGANCSFEILRGAVSGWPFAVPGTTLNAAGPDRPAGPPVFRALFPSPGRKACSMSFSRRLFFVPGRARSRSRPESSLHLMGILPGRENLPATVCNRKTLRSVFCGRSVPPRGPITAARPGPFCAQPCASFARRRFRVP